LDFVAWVEQRGSGLAVAVGRSEFSHEGLESPALGCRRVGVTTSMWWFWTVWIGLAPACFERGALGGVPVKVSCQPLGGSSLRTGAKDILQVGPVDSQEVFAGGHEGGWDAAWLGLVFGESWME